MIKDDFQPAKVGNNFQFVIDSDGNKLRLNDPRVVHVWSYSYYRHVGGLLSHLLKRKGWRFRFGPPPSNTLLRKAKQLCSGKECPALNPIMGAVLHDLEHNRKEDEVTLYYGLDCVGPCAAGVWPLTCAAFVQKLKVRNVVFPGHPAVHNNYFGQGVLFAWELFSAFAIADILAEAEIALRCTADDLGSALAAFDEASGILCEKAEKGLAGFEGALKEWTRKISGIPLQSAVDEFPKIRMIGGGNGFLFHETYIDFFAGEKILVKLNTMTDFITHVDSDLPRLVAFEAAQGVAKQYALPTRVLAAVACGGNRWERGRAFLHAVNAKAGGITIGRLRRIAGKSRLLFGDDVTFARQSVIGDKTFPDQLMLEATCNVGLLSAAIDSGLYHGGFHSNSFNCSHGVIGQALSKNLALSRNFPFVVLELDEIDLTAQNHSLLESLCIKARRTFQRRK
jgi:hypothetical protein